MTTVQPNTKELGSTMTGRVDQRAAEHRAAQEANFQRRWILLAVFCVAQVMVVLDATIINIAMPQAQRALGFSDANRQWLVTGYALAFGSLLLLGGRLGDRIGRKNLLNIGIVGFALASALGGLAVNFEMIVGARVLQGVFGAAMAPAALGLLTSLFHGHPKDRSRAFGIYGAVAGAGGSLGLILGGFLTEYVDWRWCLLVNVPIAAVTLGLSMAFLRGDKPNKGEKIDVVGAILVTLGLFFLVYAISNAETHGFGNSLTLTLAPIGVVLIAVFCWWQTRTDHALMPLSVVLDRTRGAGYLSFFLVCAGMFGVFFFVAQYLAGVLHYTPVQTGFAFMPMTIPMIIVSSFGLTLLLPRFGPKKVVVTGLLVAALGTGLLTRIDATSGFWTGIAPGLFLVGLGAGTVFAPAIAIATNRVSDHESGVAAALVNMSQQLGGSIGTATLSSIAATSAATYAASHPGGDAAILGAVHGYDLVFTVVVAIYLAAAVLAALIFKNGLLDSDD